MAAIIAASASAINILVTIANMILNSINHRKSIFANIISSNRVIWIEELRRDISKYIGFIENIVHLKDAENSANSKLNHATFFEEKEALSSILDNARKDFRNKLEECIVLQSYLHIKLDVNQTEQCDLYKKIENVWTNKDDIEKFVLSVEELTTATRNLLKKEWAKVERLR